MKRSFVVLVAVFTAMLSTVVGVLPAAALAPLAPTGVGIALDGTSTGVVVTWAPDAGSVPALDDYTVVLTGPGGSTATAAAGATSQAFPALAPGSYTAIVTANNADGSTASTSAGPVTVPVPASAPSAPTGVSAGSPTSTSLVVSWTPGATNGSTVTGFTVAASPGGATASAGAGATSVTVPGLNPSTAYTFTVVANSSDQGSSPASASSAAVSTLPPPVVGPGNFAVAATAVSSTQIDVSWGNAGGTPAATYTVSVSPNNGTITQGAGRTATITGLTPNTLYTVTVVADNAAAGSVTRSDTATTNPPPVVGPGNFTVTANATGATTASLSWTNAGGTPAATYSVSVSPAGGTVTQGAGRTATVTGLSPSTTYTFTVVADNAAAGSVSRSDTATTSAAPAVGPGPFAVAATAVSSTQIDVSWGNAGGTPAATYTVSVSPNNGTITQGAGRTATITGLTPNTLYTVTVVADNAAAGNVTRSDTARTNPPPAVAPGPFTVTASIRDANSVNLSWTNAGGTPAATYAVTVNGNAGTVTQGPGRTATVSGLTSGITYTFTVTATNSAGSTNDSDTARPAGGPATPGRPTATPVSDTEIRVNWTAPDNNGSVISGYEINVVTNNSGVKVVSVGASPTNATIDDLQPNTSYIFQVTAVSNLGDSAGSSFSTPVSTLDTPGAPTNVDAVRGAESVNSITVDWDAPGNNGGSAVTGYVVTLTPDNGGDTISFEVDDPSVTTQEVGGLSPGNYAVKVQAENAFGLGDSGFGPDVLIPDVPGLLRSIVASNTTPFGNTVEVSWEAPTNTGGLPIDGYRVTMAGQSANVGPTATFARIGPLPAGFYEATIQAFGPAGDGPVLTSNQIEVRGLPPFNSVDAFINQQYLDFLGRSADDAGRSFWAARTAADGSNMDGIIISFMNSPEFAPRRSVVRLYQAYFRRLPDPVGFDFWSQRLAAGQGSLEEVSQFFASGDEFRDTYGSLSNEEFVDLVYQNVLGRPGEASGRTFWIGQLDAGLDRGRLMTLFSESPEFIATSGPSVDVVVTYRGLLDRLPDDEGFAFWRGQIASDPNALSTLIQQFLGSEEYGERVTP